MRESQAASWIKLYFTTLLKPPGGFYYPTQTSLDRREYQYDWYAGCDECEQSFTIYASSQPSNAPHSPPPQSSVLRTPAFQTKIDALGIDLAWAGDGAGRTVTRGWGTQSHP